MADLHARIIPLKTEVAGRAPDDATMASLGLDPIAVGEIAVNLTDQLIYSKRTDGTVVRVGGAIDRLIDIGDVRGFSDMSLPAGSNLALVYDKSTQKWKLGNPTFEGLVEGEAQHFSDTPGWTLPAPAEVSSSIGMEPDNSNHPGWTTIYENADKLDDGSFEFALPDLYRNITTGALTATRADGKIRINSNGALYWHETATSNPNIHDRSGNPQSDSTGASVYFSFFSLDSGLRHIRALETIESGVRWYNLRIWFNLPYSVINTGIVVDWGISETGDIRAWYHPKIGGGTSTFTPSSSGSAVGPGVYFNGSTSSELGAYENGFLAPGEATGGNWGYSLNFLSIGGRKLADLTDVSPTPPAVSSVLAWDGSEWAPQTGFNQITGNSDFGFRQVPAPTWRFTYSAAAPVVGQYTTSATTLVIATSDADGVSTGDLLSTLPSAVGALFISEDSGSSWTAYSFASRSTESSRTTVTMASAPALGGEILVAYANPLTTTVDAPNQIGDLMVWDGAQFSQPSSSASVNLGLSQLQGVDLSTSPENGQALIWDSSSSSWKPGAGGGGGGSTLLAQIQDVDLTTPAADGQVLVFEQGSSTWKAGDLPAGQIRSQEDFQLRREPGALAVEVSHTWSTFVSSGFPDAAGEWGANDFEGFARLWLHWTTSEVKTVLDAWVQDSTGAAILLTDALGDTHGPIQLEGVTAQSSGRYLLHWNNSELSTDAFSAAGSNLQVQLGTIGLVVQELSDGELLRYNAQDDKFENQTLSLEGLTDISLTALQPGHVLTWNGQSWGNAESSGEGGAGAIRVDEIQTASNMENQASGDLAFVNLGRSGDFVQVTTSEAAWVRFYPTAEDRTADSPRNIDSDPDAGSGVLLEIITNAAGEVVKVTPGAGYYNNDVTPDEVIYARVTNLSGSTTDISVAVRAYGVGAGGTAGGGGGASSIQEMDDFKLNAVIAPSNRKGVWNEEWPSHVDGQSAQWPQLPGRWASYDFTNDSGDLPELEGRTFIFVAATDSEGTAVDVADVIADPTNYGITLVVGGIQQPPVQLVDASVQADGDRYRFDWLTTGLSAGTYGEVYDDGNPIASPGPYSNTLEVFFAPWSSASEAPLAEGDVLQWDATDEKFKPARIINLDDLKIEVAASTSFADFQARIAAL